MENTIIIILTSFNNLAIICYALFTYIKHKRSLINSNIEIDSSPQNILNSVPMQHMSIQNMPIQNMPIQNIPIQNMSQNIPMQQLYNNALPVEYLKQSQPPYLHPVTSQII
jgi:hypothetical protein